MKKLLGCFLCVMLVAFGAQAHALLITPGSAIDYGPETSQAAINAEIADQIGDSVLLYKNDVGTGESGSLAGSYETEFFNTPTDPSAATIEHIDDSPIVGPAAYLLVKDGNHFPAWYLFNLVGWDGTATLSLNGFWPNQGAISHVTLYGTAVPEPPTMALTSLGLLMMGAFMRRKFRK